jgi:hypothetical protein
MKNLTYNQLIELAPKDRPFQIEFTNGITLWVCMINKRYLQSCFDQEDGTRIVRFKEKNARVTLIDPRYQKPEVLKVGQKVRIMESARECGNYTQPGSDNWEKYINTEETIMKVIDGQHGVAYRLNNGYCFPHYCVMPVEEEKEDDDLRCIPGFEGMIEEFEGLVVKAQEIVDKYKK